MANPSLLILPGDGIGPEVMAEVRRVIDWMGARRGLKFDETRIEDSVAHCALGFIPVGKDPPEIESPQDLIGLGHGDDPLIVMEQGARTGRQGVGISPMVGLHQLSQAVLLQAHIVGFSERLQVLFAHLDSPLFSQALIYQWCVFRERDGYGIRKTYHLPTTAAGWYGTG